MPAACCITLPVFPETVWSLSITGSLNTNGLVIVEVYTEPGKSIYLTKCTLWTWLLCWFFYISWNGCYLQGIDSLFMVLLLLLLLLLLLHELIRLRPTLLPLPHAQLLTIFLDLFMMLLSRCWSAINIGVIKMSIERYLIQRVSRVWPLSSVTSSSIVECGCI